VESFFFIIQPLPSSLIWFFLGLPILIFKLKEKTMTSFLEVETNFWKRVHNLKVYFSKCVNVVLYMINISKFNPFMMHIRHHMFARNSS
jgi:hypothetical protein